MSPSTELLHPCRVALGWASGPLSEAPALVWSILCGDLGIAAAYAVIAAILFKVGLAERNPFPDLTLLFSGFIAWCGGTHVMAVWVLFFPHFAAQALVLWICLVHSALATFVLLWKYRRLIRWDLALDAMNLTMAKDAEELRQRCDALERLFRSGERAPKPEGG